MDTRERIRRWMLDTMRRQGWSAERWAKFAGTSATNITRFLKADSGFVPSAPTLAKLAQAAGTQPTLIGVEAVPLHRVPVVDAITASLFHSPALTQEIARMRQESVTHVTVPFQVSADAYAVVCPSNNLSGVGIAQNDMLVIDPREPREHGCLMLYLTIDGLEVGQSAGQSLISQKPAGVPPKEPDSVETVVLLGRIVQHIRRV